MTTSLPVVDVVDGVATVRLVRPDAGNALDLPTALALRDAVARLDELAHAAGPGALRCVVLRSNGRLFCAGGDVRAMTAAPDRSAFVAELAGLLHEALTGLRSLPVPVVAAVHGPAAGAGLGLVLAADVVVASEQATFLAAYAAVGLSPDCGVSALLPLVVGPRRAALLLLTGLRIDAPTALEWGLVGQVCAADDLDASVDAVVAGIVAQPALAVGEAARLLRAAPERAYADHLADEAATIARLSTTPDADRLLRAFGADASGHRDHPTEPTENASPKERP
ncbi:enoyl-CoA hydratase/isomerase family protein [Intrasporangium sp. YIM S08009]|uniref:enoyl-CoA hydratase/isomerase family protein n=1 Tax=Intrasporangium zincisolvens TaxID=3080018 RepID=UPI002B061512|nr:enoyl-CoA hydratase-related protein [Intrasporangium sp. YIM S08009]